MKQMKEYRILIDTTDDKGLVYKISKVIYENNLNIEKNSEYVDEDEKKFFMRTVVSGEINKDKLIKELDFATPNGTSIKITDNSKKDLVLLATKESHVLGDLLIRYIDGELNANIKAVVSNHDELRDLVEKFDIPFHYVCADDMSREDHEIEVMKEIDIYSPDLVVLAKYMRILTPNFVNAYSKKVLNIHHSFLPAFIGANPYKQAHHRGVKIIGATAHFVTDDLDEGPIISQDIVRVDHSFSWQEMRRDGRNVEKVVLSNALQLLLEDRVFIHGNKTVIL
jgi:formyltetrahydrofolate deformylase